MSMNTIIRVGEPMYMVIAADLKDKISDLGSVQSVEEIAQNDCAHPAQIGDHRRILPRDVV